MRRTDSFARALRRGLVLASLAAASCRPESYGEPMRVRVPVEDTLKLPQPSRADTPLVEVREGSHPRVLRPNPSVEVQVPADEPLPRAMRGG
jgi:hypothetical protein